MDRRSETSRLNALKGGRPPGRKDNKTLEKDAVKAAINKRVFEMSGVLINAQATLAKGQTFLYRIDKIKHVGPKGGISYQNQKPVLVTSQQEIEDYLNDLVENGDMDNDKDPSASYYYLTAKEPSNMAIDSLFNRTFGKPVQPLGGEDGEPIKIDVNITPVLKKAYGN
jgi:hypothetical protein